MKVSQTEVVQSIKSQIPNWRLLLQPDSPYLTLLKSLATGQPGNSSTQNIFSNTHLWLLHHSFELVKPQGILGANLAVLARQPRGFYATLCQGILDADQKAPYNDPVFGRVPTWASHFYDPDSETHWLGQTDHTAVTCGSSYYDLAREAYLSGDLSASGYYLGLSLHYLTDLTQPMHAANFTWFHSWQFGYHTSFEQYACHCLPSLTLQRIYQPLLPTATTTASDFLRSVARRTKDRFLESICRSNWVQSYNRLTCDDSIWDRRVGRVLPVILNDAVQLTAQYLLLWMESVHVSASRGTQILRYSQAALYATMKAITRLAGK